MTNTQPNLVWVENKAGYFSEALGFRYQILKWNNRPHVTTWVASFHTDIYGDGKLREDELLETCKNACELHHTAILTACQKFYADGFTECEKVLQTLKEDPNEAEAEMLATMQHTIPAECEGAKDKWIPVSERLPEEGQEVLIYSKHDWVIADTYNGPHEPWEKSVTHWQPLPQPPKDNQHE